MLEHFKKWMYINDVNNENLFKVARIIEQTRKKPIIFTHKGEVLYYFWLLLNGKIKLSTFFMFNDIFVSLKPYNYLVKNPYDAVYYVKNLSNEFKKGKIFVFDKYYDLLIKKEQLDDVVLV